MGQDSGTDDKLREGKTPTTKPRPRGTASAPEPAAQPAAPTPDREPLTPFPVGVFPGVVRRLIGSVAAAVQVPADIPAVTALAVAATAIGASRVYTFDGSRRVLPSLFVAVIGPSGSGKSPSMDYITGCLYDIENQWLDDHEKAKAAYRKAMLGEGESTTTVEVGGGKVTEKTVAVIEGETTGVEPPELPRRLLVDDITTEALVAIHSKCPYGFLVDKDEISGWVHSMDMYRGGKGEDRQKWLKIYDGKTLTIDRKGGDGCLRVNRPCVTLLGGIQPSKLDALASKDLAEDGMMPRFMFCNPDGLRSDEDFVKSNIEAGHLDGWKTTVLTMLDLRQDDDGQPQRVDSSSEAIDVYVAWYNRNSAQMRADDFPPALVPVWAKFRTLALKVALILHQLAVAAGEETGTEVSAETMDKATEVVDWAKGQARKTFGAMGEDAMSRKIQRLFAHIQKKYKPDSAGNYIVEIRSIVQSKVFKPGKTDEVRRVGLEIVNRELGKCEHGLITVNRNQIKEVLD